MNHKRRMAKEAEDERIRQAIEEQLAWAKANPDPWIDCDCRGVTGCDKCEKTEVDSTEDDRVDEQYQPALKSAET